MSNSFVFSKYIRSFFKSDWTAADYPVLIRDQGESPNHPRYVAQVSNWWTAVGLGASKEEAIADLQGFLDRYKNIKGSLPRPGTNVPLEFSSNDRIREHHDLLETFICQVLDVPDGAPIMISDESTLGHFEDAVSGASIEDRFQEVFGVDVAGRLDTPIVEIFDDIVARG